MMGCDADTIWPRRPPECMGRLAESLQRGSEGSLWKSSSVIKRVMRYWPSLRLRHEREM